jgi:hypothetical protein
MLRACALHYGRRWNESLPYTEFSYNDSFQENLEMTPFEMLYGHRCQTLMFWSETRERKVFGPDIFQEAERQVHMVRENLRIVKSRQKRYADHRRRELSLKLETTNTQGVTHERVTTFQGVRQAHTMVHWSIQDR